MKKLITKIIKLGTSFYGIQVNLNEAVVWGKFIDNTLSAEEMFNVSKNLFTANKDMEIEIEYTQAEGKKNIMISSVKEIVDGKVVEPSKEQTVKPKPEAKKTREVCTPDAINAQKGGYKVSSVQNSTQVSIERQQASKSAVEAIQTLTGHIDPNKIEVLVNAYNVMFDAAIKKIQG